MVVLTADVFQFFIKKKKENVYTPSCFHIIRSLRTTMQLVTGQPQITLERKIISGGKQIKTDGITGVDYVTRVWRLTPPAQWSSGARRIGINK